VPQFDVVGARKAGASDDEILSYLAKGAPGFDIQGALGQASKQEVISYLSTHSAPPRTSKPDFSASPPPAAGPHVQMQEHDLLGPIPDNFSTRTGKRIESNIRGPIDAVLNATPESAQQARERIYPPGMNKAAAVATIGPRMGYRMGKGLVEDYRQDPANLAGDVATGIIAGAASGAESPRIPANREVIPGKSWVLRQELTPEAEPAAASPALSRIRRAALNFALKKVPGYHTVKDVAQFVQDVAAIAKKEIVPPEETATAQAAVTRSAGGLSSISALRNSTRCGLVSFGPNLSLRLSRAAAFESK
jgi:hypothetical protein